jgi:hypothetical protein
MQNLEFGDNFYISASTGPTDGGWWILPSLKLLIEQVEFALALGGEGEVRQCEKIAGNPAFSDDITPPSLLRNEALKVCDMRLRDTLEFLTDVKNSTDGFHSGRQSSSST